VKQGKVPASAAQTMNAPALSALWTAMGFARVRYAACAYGYLPEVLPTNPTLPGVPFEFSELNS
jgi:hypothetical protein